MPNYWLKCAQSLKSSILFLELKVFICKKETMSFSEDKDEHFMEKEKNVIGMPEKAEEPEKKSHLLAISLVLGMALFNVAAEQVDIFIKKD